MIRLNSLKTLIFICFILSAVSASAAFGDFDRRETVPKPRLIAPSAERVSVKRDEGLTVIWDMHTGSPAKRRYYELKIYKGYKTYADYLVYDSRVDPGSDRMTVPGDIFDDGSVYTVTLRQFYIHGRSEEDYNSFEVDVRE